MAKEKMNEDWNSIEIANMKVASTRSDMRELLDIADKLLRNHKDVIKEKEMWVPHYIE